MDTVFRYLSDNASSLIVAVLAAIFSVGAFTEGSNGRLSNLESWRDKMEQRIYDRDQKLDQSLSEIKSSVSAIRQKLDDLPERTK